VRVDGAVDVFNDPVRCANSNITLQAPVHYFATLDAHNNSKYQNAFLEQVVTCSSLQGVSPLRLKVPSPDFTSIHFVDSSQGGYVQPLINYGTTKDFEDAKMINCHSKGPIPWASKPTLSLMDVHGEKMRANINNVFGVIVSNPPVESDGTGADHRGNETFLIDLATGDITQTSHDDDDTGFNWKYFVIPCICCVLVAGISAFCFAKDMKGKGAKKPQKKRATKALPAPPVAPTATPVEAAPLIQLPQQTSYITPQSYQISSIPSSQQSFVMQPQQIQIPVQQVQQVQQVQPVQQVRHVTTAMPMAMPMAMPPQPIATATPTPMVVMRTAGQVYQQGTSGYQQMQMRFS
jgi:hypothetical protein